MGKAIVAVVLSAAVFAGLGYWLGSGSRRSHAEPFKYAGTVADATSDASTVALSARVVQNLGVRTAKARSGSIEQRFEVTGAVAYNERAVVDVQARAVGFIEKLHRHAEFDPVARGAPLAQIMFPEWAAAQEQFLLLERSDSEESKRLVLAARQRLRLLGMSEQQITALEREPTGLDQHAKRGAVPRTHFTLTAPISGVIIKLDAREGATVSPGQTLYRIVDLSSVWVNAEVPEAQAAWVTPGAQVEARVPAYPGADFSGRVEGLLPVVSAATRTVRARIELDNRGGHLLPGMFATIAFQRPGARKQVLVPSEAVIRTGARSVVILALGEGRFRSAEVEVGFESGGQSQIRKGLKAGDEVVLSGQFLIDSEASLLAAVSRLEGNVQKGKGDSVR